MPEQKKNEILLVKPFMVILGSIVSNDSQNNSAAIGSTSRNFLCWCVLPPLVWLGVYWSSKNCNENFENDSIIP